jgi:haloalkane dehalogenase
MTPGDREPPMTIEAADPHPRRRTPVLDTEMSYVDTGRGDPIVFLHGNPTSSYVWRNIIPYVDHLGRCLAPDLVGMGQSGKSPLGRYRFADHARYLEAWFDALGLRENLTLVVHDWGSALGFDWARRHPDSVSAIAHLEAIALPRRWSDFGEFAGLFTALRSPRGEQMVLDDNVFVERVLPGGVIRPLGESEMQAYRAPFREREARRPTLAWPREIPIEGEPADVQEIVEANGRWMSESGIPKLLVLGEPGAIVTGRTRDFCRTWPNQREVTVRGRHFLQEDAPHEIGTALAQFIESTRARSS